MDELVCGVCSEEYCGVTHEPVVLPLCGHTYCRPCLNTIQQDRQGLECPSCRRKDTVHRIEHLPTAFIILSLANTIKRDKPVCTKHKEDINYWCRVCQEPLCCDCLLECHRATDHDVVKLTTIVDERKREIADKGNQVLDALKTRETDEARSVIDHVLSLLKICEATTSFKETAVRVSRILDKSESTNDLDETILNYSSMESILGSSMSMLRLEDNGNHPEDSSAKVPPQMGLQAESWIREALPLKCCAFSQDGRHAKIYWKDGQLYLHSLGNPRIQAHIKFEITMLESLISLWSPCVFMDLSFNSRPLGRIIIRLWGRLQRAQHFLQLCIGVLGSSYKGSHFAGVYRKDGNASGECLKCEEYICSNGTKGRKALLDNLEWKGEYSKDQVEGMVVAAGGGKAEWGGAFHICTRVDTSYKFSCPFGEVVQGLDVVKEVVTYDPVSQVKICDTGVIIDLSRKEHKDMDPILTWT